MKLEAVATVILDGHRANDAAEMEPTFAAKTQQRHERLTHDVEQLCEWLATHPEDRRDATGAVRKSNRT